MYWCHDCESEFSELKIFTETHGLDTPPYEERPCCPACGSEDIEPLYYCDVCRKWYEDKEMLDEEICKKCATRLAVSIDKDKREILARYNEAEQKYIKDYELL